MSTSVITPIFLPEHSHSHSLRKNLDRNIPVPPSHPIDTSNLPLPAAWMTGNFDFVYPPTQGQNSEYSFPQTGYYTQPSNSNTSSFQDWSMYQNNFGTAQPAFQHSNAYAVHRGHKRQASDSTIQSNGPDSPYNQQSTSFPYVVNNDRSPTAINYFGDDGSFSKPRSADNYQAFPVGYMPSQLSHTPAAHAAFRNMSVEQHQSTDDVPDFASSRHSTSTHGRNTPTTPRTGNGEESDDGAFKVPANGESRNPRRMPRMDSDSQNWSADFRAGPRVELYRTESAACQDELYNPANFMANQQTSLQVAQPRKDLLSPHSNLVNERVRTANSVRSQSPIVASQRDRSPFRTGSPLAPVPADFSSPGPVLSSAEATRRQQRDQASAQEFARHQPQLRREATQTISPKDALLDYNDTDQDSGVSMFSDTIPAGYARHFGGTETFQNNFVSGTNQAFGQFAPPSQQANLAGFRSADGTNTQNYASFMPSNTFQQQFKANSNMPAPESTPEFPAHLTSMESSVSDNPPLSSQESTTSPIQRPAHTGADSGSYTCTSQGCSQRFESPIKLQKHKREVHQPTYSENLSASASASASASPGHSSDESIDLGTGLTSSALAARNSQAGPHKCTRINPSTGKPCNTIFSRPYDLTRHEDTIHNRQKQKVRCQFCREEKTFSRNDALTRHMRVVHPEVDFQGKRGRRDY